MGLLLPLLAMPLVFLALLRLWRGSGHGNLAFAVHLTGATVTGVTLAGILMPFLRLGDAEVLLELLVLIVGTDVAVVSAFVLALKRWPASNAEHAGLMTSEAAEPGRR